MRQERALGILILSELALIVLGAVGSVLQSLTAMVGGAILALVYGSELRTRFRGLRDALRPGGGTAA